MDWDVTDWVAFYEGETAYDMERVWETAFLRARLFAQDDIDPKSRILNAKALTGALIALKHRIDGEADKEIRESLHKMAEKP